MCTTCRYRRCLRPPGERHPVAGRNDETLANVSNSSAGVAQHEQRLFDVAAALAGEALGEPKSADGAAEMVRVPRVARTSAVRARAKAYTALQDLVVTAPEPLREQLAGLYKGRLLQACAELPAAEILTTPTDAITTAIKSLAARCRERPRSTPHQGIRSARNFGCGSGSRQPVARFDPS
jgi:hypothetical protein